MMPSTAPTPPAIATAWNALMAATGAAQAARKGPKNTGLTLPPPRTCERFWTLPSVGKCERFWTLPTYETEQERRFRELYRADDSRP
jgi:hypothetical protein